MGLSATVIIAIISIVLYVISLFLRRKNPKIGRIISYIALVLMIIAIVIKYV